MRCAASPPFRGEIRVRVTRNQAQDAEVTAARPEHHFHVSCFRLVQPFTRVVVDDAQQRLSFRLLGLLLPEVRVRHFLQPCVVDAVVLDRARRSVQHEDLVERCRVCGNLQTSRRLASVRRPAQQHRAIRCHRQVVLLLRLQHKTLLVRRVDSNNTTRPSLRLFALFRHHTLFSLAEKSRCSAPTTFQTAVPQ